MLWLWEEGEGANGNKSPVVIVASARKKGGGPEVATRGARVHRREESGCGCCGCCGVLCSAKVR